ncbi:N-myc-interactor isoform X2 [Melanotaenia boesemani]|uniref:N-myc-interactor isoform X2 n=1 Tax=Melanotaenia boesemani TaxID=1250792 RepID=UPI001C03BE60|nr:N-myc-interactor isoform X2 [Melanotaenia boesemani]
MADSHSDGAVDGGLRADSLEEALTELKLWKDKVEKAGDMKTGLMLKKLEEADNKSKAQQEMMACVKKQEDCQREFTQSLNSVQDEILQLSQHKQDLLEELRRCQTEMEAKRAESTKLKQKFKVFTRIPDTEVKFVGQNEEAGGEGASAQPIRGVFTISQIPALLLKGGHALITFEQENVASQVLKMAKCSVSCENSTVDVKPRRVSMDSAVKYEVNLDVSRKELEVFSIPPALPEERMKDRLEISFSKPSLGGGEVENVDYNERSGTGRITFLHPGVAEQLAMKGGYKIHLDSEVKVKVGPAYTYQLNKFQTFCCSTKRTVLIDDIEDVEDEEDLQDHLEIHFQKPSNSGGEIENIAYISEGKALQAFFCEEVDN